MKIITYSNPNPTQRRSLYYEQQSDAQVQYVAKAATPAELVEQLMLLAVEGELTAQQAIDYARPVISASDALQKLLVERKAIRQAIPTGQYHSAGKDNVFIIY